MEARELLSRSFVENESSRLFRFAVNAKIINILVLNLFENIARKTCISKVYLKAGIW